MFRSGVPPHMGQSPVPGSEAIECEVRTNTPETRSSARTALRITSPRFDQLQRLLPCFIGCASRFLICLHTPLCCRNRVPLIRCRRCRGLLVYSASDQFVQSSTRLVLFHRQAKPYRALLLFHPACFQPAVSFDTTCRVSTHKVLCLYGLSRVAMAPNPASGYCRTE